nr:RNA-directed DNA polymerase, eukaryota [Tanacetum cinerariifolium]
MFGAPVRSRRNENIEQNIVQEGETLGEKKADSKQKSKNDVEESICSGHFKKSKMPRSGGSILLLIDELVKEGEVVVMGDFNEVCNKDERFGSIFNKQGANVFNSFISNADLVEETPNTDSNALTKMMKKLKYLKDKIRIWNRSCKEKMNNRKRSLKAELAEFDFIIDKGEVEADVVNIRNEVVKLLQDVEKIHVTPRQWQKLGNAT